MVEYDNDEDALRREFGSDTELDELETAGSRADSGIVFVTGPRF